MCSWSVCSYILSNHSLQSCSNPFWYIILYQYQRIDPLRPNQQQWCITLQLHHQCISMVTEWMPLTQSHNGVFDFKKCINHLAQKQLIEMVWWYWNNWRKCIFDCIIMQVIFFIHKREHILHLDCFKEKFNVQIKWSFYSVLWSQGPISPYSNDMKKKYT